MGRNGGLRQKSCICTRGIEGLDTLQGHSQSWDPKESSRVQVTWVTSQHVCLWHGHVLDPTMTPTTHLGTPGPAGQSEVGAGARMDTGHAMDFGGGWPNTKWLSAWHKGPTARVPTTGHGQSPLLTSPEAGGSLGRNLSLASAPIQSKAALSISKQ